MFINCPFDEKFLPLMESMIFTVHDCGFWSRCAKEGNKFSVVRYHNILKIIEECQLGIHDLSRTEVGGRPPLPRFNMPFELGLFLGAKTFGSQLHRRKTCLILDSKRHQYQRTLSDISGQDPDYHRNKVTEVILKVRDWLSNHASDEILPGADLLYCRFQDFNRDLRWICKKYGISREQLSFADYRTILKKWLKEHEKFPSSAK